MDLTDELIWFACDDRADVRPLIVRWIFPAFPQASEDDRSIVLHANRAGANRRRQTARQER